MACNYNCIPTVVTLYPWLHFLWFQLPAVNQDSETIKWKIPEIIHKF